MQTGETNNRLIAIRYVGKMKNNQARWLFLCECGVEKDIIVYHVKTGATKSCGCLLREIMRGQHWNKQHGYFGTRTYRSWNSMKSRCENPKATAYERYGGAGIKVCRRWQKFENFLEDMGERPDGKTLDRINNLKGYSKENCRWATIKEQQNNRKNVKKK